MNVITKTIDIGNGTEISIETGKLAKQADGSIVLRAGGTISESSNESVPHGSHHSIILKIGDGITISKKKWLATEKNLLESSNNQTSFVLVAIDTGDCGIAKLRGTHLEFIPNIYSGSGGKRYKTNFNIEKFFEQVQLAVSTVLKEGDSIVIFGPGETKKRFAKEKNRASSRDRHIFWQTKKSSRCWFARGTKSR